MLDLESERFVFLAEIAALSQKEGELNVALAIAQAKALGDVVAARAVANAEVSAAHVEAKEEVATAQEKVEKAAEHEFRAGFFQGLLT